MGFFRYYRQVLGMALRHSLGIADLFSSITAAALAVIIHYWPESQSVMSALAWQIPIWTLAGVMVVRIVCAPYWIHKEVYKSALVVSNIVSLRRRPPGRASVDRGTIKIAS